MKKVKIKDSYGIALIKPAEEVGEKLRILLVKKRCSHYYCSFVHGNYQIDDENRIRKMFNNMTVSEKTYVLGGNFDEIWYKMWLHHPLCSKSIKDYFPKEDVINIEDEYYRKCEKKYYELFRTGKIPKLLENTRSISGIWEIPKGKRKIKSCETPLECAVREFHEEVNIKPGDYEFAQPDPIQFQIEDDGVIYKIHIFMCRLVNKNWRPEISFNRYSFFTEVDDMMWFTCNMIIELNLSEKQKEFLLTQYKVISNKYRKIK